VGGFRLSFPITCINRLREILHVQKGIRLSNLGHLVLDAVRKSAIESVSECTVALVDLCGKTIELDEVFADALVVFHL
jgi:hypothetical protein